MPHWQIRLLLPLVVVIPSYCLAEPTAVATDFEHIRRADASLVQIRISDFNYWKPCRTLVFTAGEPPIQAWVLRRDLERHFDWKEPDHRITSRMQSILDEIGRVPELTRGGNDTTGVLSLSVHVSRGDTLSQFESVLDSARARRLFEALFRVFSTRDVVGREPDSPRADGARRQMRLEDYACIYNSVPGAPQDVTQQVSIQMSPAQRRPDGTWDAAYRVTNVSRRSIAAPIRAVLCPGGSFSIRSGTDVCRPSYGGVVIGCGRLVELSDRPLRPGRSVRVRILFANDEGEPIVIGRQRVYAGPGIL